MTLRETVFWAFDRARGGHIKREILEIEAAVNQPSAKQQQDALEAQLLHAGSNVPFYEHLRGIRKLEEFPVVNKATIKEAGDRFIATGTDILSCTTASTSGSTGTPFSILHDRRKRRRVSADAIYWGRQAGYELGLPLAHLKVWSDRNRITPATRRFRNIIPIDTTKLTGEEILAALTAAARNRPLSVISYASSLDLLARSLESETFNGTRRSPLPRIASIVAQSEHLPSEARRLLREHLGVDPVSRYGLEEIGIVGQQARNGNNDYRVNSSSVVVEILEDASPEPAPPGRVGRIVVTELINRAQPLIRYDTGDLGAFRVDEHGRLDTTKLAVVEGRKLDQVYDADDRPLTSMVMYNLWWRFPEIRQYQLVQKGRADYLLRLNVSPGFNDEADVIHRFKEIVGASANVEVELTTESFVLSSGKRKSVVSNYKPAMQR
ncbi:hypothetical protein [Dietzia lutea]|uniref:hypothetical protein n=1 Tax=Dietzia lutea TaxID=546160 RepID=UPI00132F9C28|nr:hypothetical protein [Dietzia lutea]